MSMTSRMITAVFIAAATAITVTAGGPQDSGAAAGAVQSPWPGLFSGRSSAGPGALGGRPTQVPFAGRFLKPAVPQARSETVHMSTVVCGTTIVKGDAKQDPKILRSIDAIRSMFSTPVVIPPLCPGQTRPDPPAPTKR